MKKSVKHKTRLTATYPVLKQHTTVTYKIFTVIPRKHVPLLKTFVIYKYNSLCGSIQMVSVIILKMTTIELYMYLILLSICIIISC